MRLTFVYTIAFAGLLTSCGSWSKYDKDTFIENCQMQKLNDAYCDCALEKAQQKYSTFDEMTADEANMAELLYSCIEKDRGEDEDL